MNLNNFGKLAATNFSRRSDIRFLLQSLVLVFSVVLIVYWIVLAIDANFDAADYGHALHMDEMITYDGVNRIQKATTPNAKLDAIVGPDQRYGRTTWYLAYFVTSIAEPFFGERGQIIATRLANVLVLLCAIGLIVISLITNSAYRALAFCAAIYVPFASYYATMPKPEPLMLLFIAAYIYFAHRKDQPLGWTFVFLGLAFGTKIVALPIVVAYAGLAVLTHVVSSKRFAKRLAVSVLAFVAGFLIAIPVIVSDPVNGFSKYLNGTWLNRSHGADNPDVGPLAWLEYIQQSEYFGVGVISWLALPILVTMAVYPTVVALLIPNGLSFLKRLLEVLKEKNTFTAATAGVGVLLVFAIMVSTPRLWGFYLFPGVLFIVIAGIAGAERMSKRIGETHRRIAFVSVLAVLLSPTMSAGIAHTTSEFVRLASRSDSADFKQKEIWYNEMRRVSTEISNLAGRRVDASFFARSWHPSHDEKSRFFPIYGPFKLWKDKRELIILHDRDVTEDKGGSSISSETKARQAEAARLLAIHTDYNSPCSASPCYKHLKGKSDGLHFFVREDVIEKSYLKSDR